MKVSRSLAISLSLILLAGVTLSTSSCGYIYQVVGKDKLNQGILKYNQGKTDEAMAFFESASQFIPDKADVCSVWELFGTSAPRAVKPLRKSGKTLP